MGKIIVSKPEVYLKCIEIAKDLYRQILENRKASTFDERGIAEIFQYADMIYLGYDNRTKNSGGDIDGDKSHNDKKQK